MSDVVSAGLLLRRENLSILHQSKWPATRRLRFRLYEMRAWSNWSRWRRQVYSVPSRFKHSFLLLSACLIGAFLYRLGTGPNASNTECVKCTGIAVSSAGHCGLTCGAGAMPNEDRTACISCPPGTAGTNGVCNRCQDGTTPDSSKFGCWYMLDYHVLSLTCSFAGVSCFPSIGSGGMCNQCGPGFGPNGARTSCVPCQGIFVSSEGRCL